MAGRIFAIVVMAIIVVVAPRYSGAFFIYSFIPLVMLAVIIAFVAGKISEKRLIVMLVLFAALIQIRHHLLFEPAVLVDSKWFIGWGRSFAAGQGFPGMWYRPPLYPFFLGLNFLFTQDLHLVVIVQRLFLIASVPVLYLLARKWSLSVPSATLGGLLFSTNSLVLQMSRSILAESLVIFLVLIALYYLSAFASKPTWRSAVAVGLLFALCAHARQIATPLLFLGIAVAVIRDRKAGLLPGVVAVAVFFIACAPWSIRNYQHFGVYSLSYHLGPNIFTKLTSFKLQNREGTAYRTTQEVQENVERFLGLEDYKVPQHPEDDWTLNRIPHVMMDSLQGNHGYSPGRAANHLVAVSLEGFAKHPLQYAESVVNSLCSLLFEHHENVPALADVIPASDALPFPLRAPFRSLIAFQGLFLFLFAVAALWKKEWIFSAVWLPFLLVCYGYGTVALIQVGFSRYTVPWAPYASLCTAYACMVPAMFLWDKLVTVWKKKSTRTIC